MCLYNIKYVNILVLFNYFGWKSLNTFNNCEGCKHWDTNVCAQRCSDD